MTRVNDLDRHAGMPEADFDRGLYYSYRMMAKALDAYGAYFQHPGWQPLH